MKRFLFAIAALGAALLGCGAADETQLDVVPCVDNTSPSNCDPSGMFADLSAPNDVEPLTVADGIDDMDDLRAMVSAGVDVQKSTKLPLLYGLPVIPNQTTVDFNTLQGGLCNKVDPFTQAPVQRCIYPDTTSKSWSWHLDASTCPQNFGTDILRTGVQLAFQDLSRQTNWTFTETQSSSAKITVFCASLSQVNQISNATNATMAFGFPYGSLTAINAISPVNNIMDQCGGTGPFFGPQFRTAYASARKYQGAGVGVNYNRFFDYFNSCHQGASAGDQIFLEVAAYNVMLHEISHSLGFGHNLVFPMFPQASCEQVDITLSTSTIVNGVTTGYRGLPDNMKSALSTLHTEGGGVPGFPDTDISCYGPFDQFYFSQQ